MNFVLRTQYTVELCTVYCMYMWVPCVYLHCVLLVSVCTACTVFVCRYYVYCMYLYCVLESSCGVGAADSEASPEREKALELIRYLVPDVLNGLLVDSLSGHALSAAGLAASFLLEAEEQAQLEAPPTSICSVIRAQKPGW